MDNLSLLDWLKIKLSDPRLKRWTRFGLALVAGLWGGLLLLASGGQGSLAYFLLGLAFGLLVWGLSARGEAAPPPNLPEFALPSRPAVALPATPSFPLATLISSLALPACFFLAVVGQLILTNNRPQSLAGLIFYLLAVPAFIWIVWRYDLLGPVRAAAAAALDSVEPAAGVGLQQWRSALLQAARGVARFQWFWLGVAVVAGGFAFWDSGGNLFRPAGVLAWGLSLASWLIATWQVDWAGLPGRLAARWQALTQASAWKVTLTRAGLILLVALGIGAFFRYASLDAIPPEMTSDHVEKLLDVSDVLRGDYHIYFERNTGREPLQFYLAVLTLKLLGTGLTHLTLKIGTATAGFLMLPFVYLLGREVEDETFGLLATLLAAISYWATAISRVGLRFPLYPLFVAPVLYCLLRGLLRLARQRPARNEFLLAGLFMGIGLNGYSPFRVMPGVVLAAVIWFALWPQARGQRRALLVNTLLLFGTALILCLPLLRYSFEPNNLFWYRTGSRLAGEYSNSAPATLAATLVTFLTNQWNALLAFNFLGDRVWVNTVPGQPLLDFVSGALLILGLVFVLLRLFVRRDWLAGVWLMAIPILMLPSTLSLAFPEENPSAVRLGGVMPVLFVLAAYPLWLLFKHLQVRWPGVRARWAGAGLAALFIGVAALANYQLYFEVYPLQYRLSAQNASEIGVVIHDFARTVGSYETVFVRPFPFWVDTRAVGMYAQGGDMTPDFGREFAIQYADLGKLQSDPRPRLFILDRLDFQTRPDSDPPTLPELRRLYPTGTLSRYPSKIPGHDFLIFFVPGTQDLDTSTLPPQ